MQTSIGFLLIYLIVRTVLICGGTLAGCIVCAKKGKRGGAIALGIVSGAVFLSSLFILILVALVAKL